MHSLADLPTQESNQDLLHCRQILYQMSYDGKLRKSVCGSDHELLIAKFRLKLKKVGKTTEPFRYGLNQSLMTIE